MSVTNGNGRRWIQGSAAWMLVAALVGSMPGVAFGIWYQHATIVSLQERFIAATKRYDQHILDFNGEVARERDEDTSLERQIADVRRDVANIQGSLPLKLPTITQLIQQDAHISAQDGRMDEIDRRLRALGERQVALCVALGKLSAASAKGAGCT